MSTAFSYRHSLSAIAAAVILTACAGQQKPNAGGAIPQRFTRIATLMAGVAHKATSSGNDLIHAVNDAYGYILTYPGGTLVESFGVTLPEASFVGACSDQSGGVFLTATVNGEDSYVLEYAHGGTTPVKTLDFDGEPDTCSVDPTTGNLAVTNSTGNYGSVGVFKGAQGNATYYSANLELYSSCAYDDAGNLFVDGQTSNGYHTYLALLELPAGSGTFETISLGKAPLQGERPGPIEWDGSYLAMGVTKPPHPQQIWHLRISGSGGTIIGRTKAKGIYHWSIQGNTLLAPYGSKHSDIALFNYPRGRKPTKVISDGLVDLSALTVSVGSSP